MLTIEEIAKNIKELNSSAKVELECIDRNGLLNINKNTAFQEANKELLRNEKLIVTGICIEDGFVCINGDDYRLLEKELKYFSIKRPTPTFDDLIDSAANAIKKKLIVNLYIGPHYIEFDSNEHSHAYDMQEAKRGIDFINSLYTETFVIENESDIDKVLSRDEYGFSEEDMSVATLVNGNKLLITRLSSDTFPRGIVIYMRSGLYKNYLDIEVLKGATVTQKRGVA